MADWRYFAPHFWNDSYILKLKPLEKYVYIYLFTNPHCNQAGLYELPVEIMSFELQLSPEEIKEIIEKFQQDGKLEYVDDVMWLKNFLKHQPNKSPLVWKRIVKDIKMVSNHSDKLIERYFKHLDTLNIPYPKDIEKVSKGYQKGIDRTIRKGKGKEKEKDLDTDVSITNTLNDKKSSSSEPSSKNIPQITFNFEKRKWENITDEDKKGWKKAYPACDITIELAKMADWLLSNPKKRKKNYRSFITNWLSRQQDRGGTKVGKLSQETEDSIAEFYKKKKGG